MHERFGTKIASFLYGGNSNDTLITNFRYQDIGEIIYMLFFAFILLFIFLICYALSNTFERHFLKKILKLFIVFGIFAILVDSIHQLSEGFKYNLLAIIEDGGEMIPISFTTAYFFKYLINNRNKNI